MPIFDKPIAIGSDHAGFELKSKVIGHLIEKGYEFVDYGTYSYESVDYPYFAHKISETIKSEKHQYGILICGSGIGVSITANRYRHIRCALCWNVEIARLSRKHNNANVLALAGRFTDEKTASDIVDTFFSTDFEEGRHSLRVDGINNIL